MKIRNGFVSNSSSSSFIIVGIQNSLKIQRLLNKIGGNDEVEDEDWYEWIDNAFTSSDYGQYTKDGLTFIWGCEKYPQYVGINPVPLLEAGLTLDQIKVQVIEQMSKFDINVKLKDIVFEYGQSHSE